MTSDQQCNSISGQIMSDLRDCVVLVREKKSGVQKQKLAAVPSAWEVGDKLDVSYMVYNISLTVTL